MLCVTATLAVAQVGFEQRREAVSVATSTQPESAILDLLKAGIDEDQPTQAFALTERWLRDNVANDPMLLYRSAKAAELSGDWSAAVALYRQYLKRADLTSPEASDAVLGAYRIQIYHLDASDAAYAFARSDGHRLVTNATARQFDRWFLDEAKRRKDREAVAKRLHALAENKVGDDLLAALYLGDFRWLLNAIDDGRLDQSPLTPELVETTKALAKAITFDRELTLLLDWSVSVKAYNTAILDGGQPAPPLAEAQALLNAYPRHAERVQLGWAGGNTGPHYRGDANRYWLRDLEAKLTPIRSAVEKLDALAQADYDKTLAADYYSGRPRLLDAQASRAWVLKHPARAN
ncbi:MAG: hypothetical protein ACPGYV_05860, partial [Phycisphaeraceae bacterium]